MAHVKTEDLTDNPPYSIRAYSSRAHWPVWVSREVGGPLSADMPALVGSVTRRGPRAVRGADSGTAMYVSVEAGVNGLRKGQGSAVARRGR